MIINLITLKDNSKAKLTSKKNLKKIFLSLNEPKRFVVIKLIFLYRNF